MEAMTLQVPRLRMETNSRDAVVTPLELFFDLVFVFALTQVTAYHGRRPHGRGVVRGLLVLAAALVELDRLRLVVQRRPGR